MVSSSQECHKAVFKFWTANFQKLGSAYFLSEFKADFYENETVIQKSEFQKKKSICDKCVSGEDRTWGLALVSQ